MTTKSKIRNTTLKRSGLIIMMLLAICAFALLRMLYTRQNIGDVARIDLPLVENLTSIETNQLEQSISFERMLRYAQEIETHDYALQSFSMSDSVFRTLAEKVDEDLLQAEHRIEEALSSSASKSQVIKLKQLLSAIKKLEGDHLSYKEHALKVIKLLEKGEVEQGLLQAEQVEEEENQFNKQIEGVLLRLELFTEALARTIEEEEAWSMQWIFILTICFTVLALMSVYAFSYKIWMPLDLIRKGAEKLGAGKLDTRISLKPGSITEDLVDAFNHMAMDLQAAQNDIERFTHFSYSTANDLKTSVKNMNHLVDMIQKAKPGDANYDILLKNIKRGTQQLSTTVEGLNHVNYIRASLQEEPQQVSFDKTLAEVAQDMIAEIKRAKATFRKDFSACPDIYYPPSHLKIIIKQLLHNAIKYKNPDKPLAIEIKTLRQKGSVDLVVKDTGLGFDVVKHREEITKPFVRLHTHVNGSGLGLYMVSMIINYHQDRMHINSQPRQGTHFTLHLHDMDAAKR